MNPCVDLPARCAARATRALSSFEIRIVVVDMGAIRGGSAL
jgi:hypothetical protein